MAQPFVEMFKHNLWANLRLLDACADLDDDVLDASVVGTAGSIRDTLAHLAGAEARYVAMLRETPHPPPEYFRFPGFAELRERARTSGEALIAVVEGQDLDRRVRGVFQDRPYELAAAIPLLAAVNHATEHRAHVNTILTQQGIEPPVLDAWFYNRQAAGR